MARTGAAEAAELVNSMAGQSMLRASQLESFCPNPNACSGQLPHARTRGTSDPGVSPLHMADMADMADVADGRKEC